MPYPKPLSEIEPLPRRGPEVRAASNEPVTRTTGCVECGYNLRGLTRDGLCPECGTPVRTSLGARSSTVVRPHLDGLLAGTLALLAATLLSPLCIVLSFACLGTFIASPAVAGGLAATCFLATLAASVVADVRLAEFARRYDLGDESPANKFAVAAGLGLLGLTAEALHVALGGFVNPYGWATLSVIGFGLLTLGAGRFVGFYRRLTRISVFLKDSSWSTWSSLGVWKATSDGLLVGCVFVMLVSIPLRSFLLIPAAFVSLLALIFYAATWLVVIFDHGRLVAGVLELRRRTPADEQ